MPDNKQKRTQLSRLWVKQKGRCYWCSRRIFMNKKGISTCLPNTATIDHYIPRAQGGTNTHDNRVAACFRCNQQKGRAMPTTFLGITKEEHAT